MATLTKKQLNMFTKDGLSIKELCSTVDGLSLWINNQGPIRRARNTYLQAQAANPAPVTTYYITGVERFRAAILLANHLFPDYPGYPNLCYPVPPSGNRFKDYDGEPVLIWHEYNSQQAYKVDGIDGFLSWIQKEAQARNNEPCLVHKYNIIVSEEPFDTFVDNFTQKASRFKINPEEIRATLCNCIPVAITTDRESCTVQHNPENVIKEYSLPQNWWVK